MINNGKIMSFANRAWAIIVKGIIGRDEGADC
jgi:hypothetical protein